MIFSVIYTNRLKQRTSKILVISHQLAILFHIFVRINPKNEAHNRELDQPAPVSSERYDSPLPLSRMTSLRGR